MLRSPSTVLVVDDDEANRVTLERIPELAKTGAEYVSVGALTHSAPAADISLDVEPCGEPR